MIEAYFRPLYQQCLIKPILKFTKNTSPIHLTLIACVFGILVLPALYLGLNKTAVLLLLISGYLDSLDGTIASQTGNFSDEGAILAIVSDRIVEVAVIIGLYTVDPVHRGWLTLSMLGSCYICITCFLMIGLLSPYQILKAFKLSPGIIERTEVFIFFILMMLVPKYFTHLAVLFIALILITSILHYNKFIKFTRLPPEIKKTTLRTTKFPEEELID